MSNLEISGPDARFEENSIGGEVRVKTHLRNLIKRRDCLLKISTIGLSNQSILQSFEIRVPNSTGFGRRRDEFGGRGKRESYHYL